jgi:TolA-binding protein
MTTLALRLASLAVVVALSGGCDSRDKKKTPEQEAFSHARWLVTAGRYDDAIRELDQYLNSKPPGARARRAMLFLGKSHLALGQFVEARQAWTTCKDAFPKKLEGHKCKYKLALLTLLEGKRDDAMAQFKHLSENPDGPLAPEATAMVRFLSQPAEAP